MLIIIRTYVNIPRCIKDKAMNDLKNKSEHIMTEKMGSLFK